jgi:hypothetical protein
MRGGKENEENCCWKGFEDRQGVKKKGVVWRDGQQERICEEVRRKGEIERMVAGKDLKMDRVQGGKEQWTERRLESILKRDRGGGGQGGKDK